MNYKEGNKLVLFQFTYALLGRGGYIANTLSRIGYDVIILTNKPAYYSNQYEFIDKEVILKVITIPFLKVIYNKAFGRILIYSYFMLSSFLQLLILKPNIIYSRGPHPFSDLISVIYKKIHRCTIYSDITDLWPDAIQYYYNNMKLIKVITIIGVFLCNISYPKIEKIITHNIYMKKILEKRYNKKTYILHGVIDLDRFKPISKKEAYEHIPTHIKKRVINKFVFIYAGIISDLSDVSMSITICKILNRYHDEFVFIILGQGPNKIKLMDEIKRNNIDNIMLLDYLPHNKMVYYYNLAEFTVLFSPVFNEGVFKYSKITLPKKFIEYSACGKPILCITPQCAASDLCIRYDAGIHIHPKYLQKTIENVYSIMKDQDIQKKYSFNSLSMAKDLFSMKNAINVLSLILSNRT